MKFRIRREWQRNYLHHEKNEAHVMYSLSVENPEKDYPWRNIAQFDTRQKALDFAQAYIEHFNEEVVEV